MALDSIGSIQENRTKYAKYFDSKGKDDMSMDTFYQLLIAEMSNQDPMEPVSNTEFISQMASFTSLQTQKDALYYNNANYAQSLVGKTVTVATVQGSEMYTDSGVVTSMGLSNGEFQVKVNGKNYAMANIMEVVTGTNPYAISGNDGAYATSLIGKKVTLLTTTADNKEVVDSGIVDRIEIKNNEISLIVKDLAYPLSSIVKIENASEADSSNDSESNTSSSDNSSYSSKTGSTEQSNKSSSGNNTNNSDTSILEENKSEPVDYTNEPDEPDLIAPDDTDELLSLFGN